VRKTLVSALAAGLVVLVSPAAHAATRDLTDPTGDVMTATVDSNGNVTKYNREHGAEGDITFARIQHTATQVVVYIRYAQLSVPKQYGEFSYLLEGNNHQQAIADVETRHAQPQGMGFAGNMTKDHQCAMAYHINYGADSVSMRLPRTCLGNAKYVRLSHITLTTSVKRDDSGKIYYDSPTRDGGTENQVSNSKTPWVVTG
jgi:hypothetical protein